ncbi:NAD(P)H-hydrate dehydratase [Actinospica sp.]|uniref:NAD(P)H-hydrate dehydratase n=1 Tax=Actinospica sp. TaxID=1872142 RepID=UPI002BCFA35A|nr:NAD(P)H-hydrate dehydratase [Actinospica sp.]HWG28102.1 NAD(P)H-hydrate dehydratase [Actinospica sp.]
MRYAHAVADVRAAERELMARLPEGALMQRAAFGLATVAAGMLREAGSVYGSRVVLLVGVGDNGGDALFAGALLAGRGVTVHAVLVDPARAHVGGLSALRDAGGRVVAGSSVESVLDRADLIVDGLLGIGGRGGLRGAFAEAAAAARNSGAPILAVDLPSGIDADTGEVAGAAVRADVTVTFGTHKPGLFVDPGAGHAGIVELVDIGLEFPASVEPVIENLGEEDVRELLPAPSHSSHKYSRGVVGLAVGSERYPGAALLATGAALRSGVGAVRYSGPVDVVGSYPEVIMGGGHVQAWVVGSGLGQDDESVRRLLNVLSTDVPVVVDADGLRLLPRKALERSAPTILTPHAGEAAALLDVPAEQIEGQRLESVRRLADSYDATVLLKGANTLIASPNSPIRVNTHASPVLATAGSGDVLAGIIGGLLAGGLSPLDAASVGAYLHGATGLLAARSGPVAAGDLVATLPLAWHNIRG